MAKNANLVLEGTKIKLWKSGDELICQAGRLLLEMGKSFEALIDKIRLIFELNSLLKNIISVDLCFAFLTGAKICIEAEEEVTFYRTLSEREKAFLKFPNK